MNRFNIVLIIVSIIIFIYLIRAKNDHHITTMYSSQILSISIVIIGDNYYNNDVNYFVKYLLNKKIIPNGLIRIDFIDGNADSLESLYQQGVRCIIGIITSTMLNQWKQFLNDHIDLIIISTSFNDKITSYDGIIRTSNVNNKDVYKSKFGAKKIIIIFDTQYNWARKMVDVWNSLAETVIGYTHPNQINYEEIDSKSKVIIILCQPNDTRVILENMSYLDGDILLSDASCFYPLNTISTNVNPNIQWNKIHCISDGMWNMSDYDLSKKIFGTFKSPHIINILHAIELINNSIILEGNITKNSILKTNGSFGRNLLDSNGNPIISNCILASYQFGFWLPNTFGFNIENYVYITHSQKMLKYDPTMYNPK